MKQCRRCGAVNPDSAVTCDCGYSFVLQAGGSGPVPMHARRVPLVIKSHALLVGAGLALNVWLLVYGGWPASATRRDDQILGLIIGSLLFPGLFLLMLSGRAWARIVLGVVTLPVGLLVLVPRTAREFTGDH